MSTSACEKKPPSSMLMSSIGPVASRGLPEPVPRKAPARTWPQEPSEIPVSTSPWKIVTLPSPTSPSGVVPLSRKRLYETAALAKKRPRKSSGW